MTKLEEFKIFVKKHPLLKQQVQNKEKTWQQLYEDYCILGEDAYEKEDEVNLKKEKKETNVQTEDMIKTIVGYIKKIDPDQVTKTVTSIQKVLELIGGFGTTSVLAKKATGDPLFDKRFDEWF